MPYDLDRLDTPFVSVDLGIVEQNIAQMHQRATSHGLKVRPHTKTHKQPFLAQLQYDAGSQSLTVAKLDEAEIMLEAGFDNLLIAYPLMGDAKAHRLANLMARGLKPTVSIDSLASMRTLMKAAAMSDRSIDVLVEVDTGFHRCGLTGTPVLELAQAIHDASGLNLAGLMSFAGHISGKTDPSLIRQIIQDDDAQLGSYAATLRQHHLPVDTLSVGGTTLSHYMQVLEHATEIRPGIYIFNDMGIVSGGSVDVSRCAARIWATVVSRPSPDRAVLDAGSKMLSTDGPLAGSYGFIVEHPNWSIPRISEEHAVVVFEDSDGPDIGERVSIVPNHVCTVMNLQQRVIGIRNNQVVASLPILARGGTR